MSSSLGTFALLLPLLLLVGCKAGPSVFERGGAHAAADTNRIGPVDTADASTLPELPSAEDEDPGLKADTPAAPVQHAAGTPDRGDPAAAGRAVATADAAPPSDGDSDVSSEPPLHFEQPEHVRGLYLSAWVAGSSRRLDGLLTLARRTEINTFVIDIKDASGYVSHRTRVPLALEAGADDDVRIRDLHGLLVKLKQAGIYPIARIVVIKDPVLAKFRPDLAVQDTAGGAWVDDKGIVWLNLFNEEVWKYHVALAKEVASYGFPEIQWDYVRFPDAPKAELARAVFPDSAGFSKPEAIRDFLQYSRKELAKEGVRVTADVFGVTTSASRDVGIGQVWKSFIDAVDVAMPMVYPSHYWEGSFGFEQPNAYPYQVVRHALRDALRQSSEVKGAGATRPWLQDFTLGKPPYGPPEVRAEIQATYDAGIQDWILWNPAGHYTEGALQPAGGFPTEPDIRVGGLIVPVSQRFGVLGEDATGKPLKTSTADSLRDTTAVADTSSASTEVSGDWDGSAATADVADTLRVAADDSLRTRRPTPPDSGTTGGDGSVGRPAGAAPIG